MKRKLLAMSLSLVIASSLVMGGCGSKTSDTDKKVETTTEVSKDSSDTKKENKKIVKKEEVANQEKTEVATATEETKVEEVKEDTKDSKADTKDNKSGTTSNSGNSGNSGSHSGNGGSSNSGNSGNHSGNGGSGNSGNTGSTSHTPTPAPSNGGGNSSGGTSSTTPTHTHNWIPITQTIHHPAETRQEDQGHYETIVDEPAWDEEVTDFDNICITCYNRSGEVIRLHSQEEVRAHINYHSSIGDSSGNYGWKEFPTGEVIHHDAITHQEWVSNIVTVTVKEAWDEVVTVGYQCSECGATK